MIPVVGKELDGVAAYILPLNKLWDLLTLRGTLRVIKRIGKPLIAMKTLAQGALSDQVETAYTFLFRKVGVSAVLVGVFSVNEAKRTFSVIGKILKGR